MSDEPRRSVRSTKGYHSHKEQEIEGNMEHPKKKGGKKGGSKKAQASKEPTPVPEPNEDGDIIRCICGATTQDADEEGEEWIACEECNTWQHNVCMGIQTENVEEIQDYYCEYCRPENHKEYFDAKDRGEEIWKTRREAYEAEKKARKNRKGKSGGTKKKKAEPKSTAQRANGRAKESPAASVREGSASTKKESATKAGSAKRKTREESHEQDSGKTKQRKVSEVSAVPATPTAVKPSASVTPAPPPPAAPTPDQKVSEHSTPAKIPMTIADLQDKNREDLAKLLRKNLETAFKTASENGHFVASADNSVSRNALATALEIEQAIHDAQEAKDSYVAQCKLVAINLKRNTELFGKLLSHELSASQLAVMSEDDMKTSEQRQKDEEELARAERQSIMVQEDGPRLRRTHKGEELVEDNFGSTSDIPSREQRDPNANMAGRSRENSPDELIEPPSDIDRASSRPKKPLNVNTQAPERKPSASEFDYNTVASKLPTPTNAQSNRRVSGPAPVPREAVVDPDVDRLLEDAPESPPYSPKEDSDPSVVWSGQIDMSAIGRFDASGKHAAGVDLVEHHSTTYLELLTRKPSITGRIEPEKADEYLCSLRFSPGSDIIVLSVTPRGEVATEEFTKVFEYFAGKNRYGVIGNRMGPAAVRDTYLIPIESGSGPMPEFMSNLEVNKLPKDRPERIMLIVIVYREDTVPGVVDGNQEPSLLNQSQRQVSQASGPSASPLTQQGSFKPLGNPAQEENQRRGEALAYEILGPDLFRAATMSFILPQAHMMVAKEWNVIKELYMSDMRAQQDLQYLGQLLADRANDPEHQQQNQQQSNDLGISPSVRT